MHFSKKILRKNCSCRKQIDFFLRIIYNVTIMSVRREDNDMKQHKRNGIEFLKYFFLAMALAGFLYYLAGEFILPSDNPEISHSCEDFLAEWTWIKPDGTQIPVTLPGKCDAKINEVVTVETTLPEDLKDSTYLCFLSLRQDMELYVDGTLRQQYSTKDTRLFGLTSSAAYVFLELSPKDAGKILTVVSQTDSPYSGLFRTIYRGDKLGVWQRTFHEFGLDLIVAFLMMILGGSSVLISIALHFCYHKKVDLEYLGWGILVTAIWVLFNSMFRQLLFHNISVASDITFFVVMLLPFPFLIYMNNVQNGRYQKLYLGAGLLAVIDLLVCSALEITNQKDFSETITYMEFTCLVAIALIGLTIILDIFRKNIHEYRLIAIGIFGSCLAAIAQIILYFNRIDTPFSGIMMAIGLIFLLITAVIHTIRDLLQIEQEKRDAILASESKARFLANMSHEIRTPIHAVLGMDEMIIRESQDPHITEYALDIQSAGKSLLSLINDILDFSKIESGSLKILPAEYELSSLLNDCSSMIQMRAKEKGLDFFIENDPGLPTCLLGDELRIRQIMVNLLTNAVKYTKKGSVKLAVNGERFGENQLLLKISVADTGIGISPEDQDKLFQSFQRVEETKNRNIEGTGLGLAITRQLAELMDGRISVESEYGKGSVFSVELPQTIVSADMLGNFSEQCMNTLHQPETYLESFQAPNGQILVVDDIPMNLKVIEGLLKNTKLRIDTAESGPQCLAKIAQKQYHIIFLDHMMPDMDGMETLERMKQLSPNPNKDTPVIMLTANAMSGAKKEYLDAGFRDYLSKPVQGAKLEKMILKYLPEHLILAPEPDNTPVSAPTPDNTSVSAPEGSASFLENLEFLDTATALGYCLNNEQLYLKILHSYIESELYDVLNALYETEDWKDYQIQIHALKSTSLSIGAQALSEAARQLEMAVKENNISYVKEHHKACMEAYRSLLSKLKRALA